MGEAALSRAKQPPPRSGHPPSMSATAAVVITGRRRCRATGAGGTSPAASSACSRSKRTSAISRRRRRASFSRRRRRRLLTGAGVSPRNALQSGFRHARESRRACPRVSHPGRPGGQRASRTRHSQTPTRPFGCRRDGRVPALGSCHAAVPGNATGAYADARHRRRLHANQRSPRCLETALARTEIKIFSRHLRGVI